MNLLSEIADLLEAKHPTFDGRQLLFLTECGAKLYKLTTKSSDTDIKGVYLPSTRDCYLQKVSKSFRYKSGNDNTRNLSTDIDVEIWSLQYFIHLLGKGDTNALDILHAPVNGNTVLKSSPDWEDLHNSRHLFYTKRFPGLLGYARKQASKYGNKGTRLAEIKKVMNFLQTFKDLTRLSDIWDLDLPVGEHVIIDNEINENKPYRTYIVCGRQFQETVTVKYVYDAIHKIADEYGNRARNAEKNEGFDWKAISHALRTAYQIIDIYTCGDIKWPLKQSKFILDVKQGKKHFATEVAPVIDDLIKNAEVLAKESNYPNKIDIEYWNRYILKVYMDNL
jgi:hypothetical protein